ncbi:ABC transporter permease [Agrobacterium vitis]|uniref:ABC transporter permease n=1 Tax=Agrobacterium vitis TaxID=373 RepID=UPI001574415E|nr:ABC transporter permease [Agrobacterium vitis]NSZ20023.1 ABC transporter permease [Agrobacterium vitis]QZO07521.1 ABC transporter permease [Agrobacterium vitis]UJL90715.1 ABC transporter permease [Agrobacterium vitis]
MTISDMPIAATPERRPLARLWLKAFLPAAAAFLLALVAGAGLILLWGGNPVVAYSALAAGAFGSWNSLAETLLRSIPLTFTGLAVAVAFRGGAFNVGAEGQLYVGATAAAACALWLPSLPGYLILPLMMAGSMVAGAAWAGLAGVLKLRFAASELITTIMLTYVGIYLVSYLLHGPLQEAAGYLPQTERLPAAARFASLIAGTRLHMGLLVTLGAAVVMQFLIWKTVWGFRLRVTGLNTRAALAAGMAVGGLSMSAFMVSGALGGLAGFMEVVGVQHRMIETLSPGYGYTGIIVALLGRTSPLGVVIAAVLFAALQVGATTMEAAAGVPATLTVIIQALVVLFLIGRPGIDQLIHILRRR